MKILYNVVTRDNVSFTASKRENKKSKDKGKGFFSPVETLPYSDAYGKAMVETQNRFRNIRKLPVSFSTPVLAENAVYVDKVTTYTPVIGNKIAQKTEGKKFNGDVVCYTEFYKPDGKTVDFVYNDVDGTFAEKGKPSVGKTTINDKVAYDLDFTDLDASQNIYAKFEAPANGKKYEDSEISRMYLQRYSKKIDDYVKYHYGKEFLENYSKPQDVMYLEMPNRTFYAVYGVSGGDKIIISTGNNFRDDEHFNPTEYEILGVFDRENMNFEDMSSSITEDEFSKIFTKAVDVCQDMMYLRDYALATYQKCDKSINLLKENC